MIFRFALLLQLAARFEACWLNQYGGEDTIESIQSVFVVRFFVLRRGSFDILFALCVFLFGEGGVGWAGFTGVRNRSALEKFEFTD